MRSSHSTSKVFSKINADIFTALSDLCWPGMLSATFAQLTYATWEFHIWRLHLIEIDI